MRKGSKAYSHAKSFTYKIMLQCYVSSRENTAMLHVSESKGTQSWVQNNFQCTYVPPFEKEGDDSNILVAQTRFHEHLYVD